MRIRNIVSTIILITVTAGYSNQLTDLLADMQSNPVDDQNSVTCIRLR